MKKYELIKKGLDDWTLKYKDKEISFKTDVELVSKAQAVRKDARIKMIMDLSKQGISIKSLVVEEKKDGKTYIDNTNKDELEKAYIEEAVNDFFNQAVKDKLGVEFISLMQDIGVTDSERESEEFANELTLALTGQQLDNGSFPSDK